MAQHFFDAFADDAFCIVVPHDVSDDPPLAARIEISELIQIIHAERIFECMSMAKSVDDVLADPADIKNIWKEIGKHPVCQMTVSMAEQNAVNMPIQVLNADLCHSLEFIEPLRIVFSDMLLSQASLQNFLGRRDNDLFHNDFGDAMQTTPSSSNTASIGALSP